MKKRRGYFGWLKENDPEKLREISLRGRTVKPKEENVLPKPGKGI